MTPKKIEDFKLNDHKDECVQMPGYPDLEIPISEPLWFCEKQYVFPNQCGGDHP